MIIKPGRTLLSALYLVSCILHLNPNHSYAQLAQPEASRQGLSSALIRWQGKPGVDRYRLQLATDPEFNDVILDQPVAGRQFLVERLPPGNYYWRVAPAARETGAFGPGNKLEVTARKLTEVMKVVAASDAGGWRTATGEVLRPISARLRDGASVDFVAMNRQGTVFAIDGTNGVGLWTSRYDASAGADRATAQPHDFSPVLVRRGSTVEQVVIGFEGGVRALWGGSGRENWRVKLEGRPRSGTSGDLDGDAASEVAVVTDNPNNLYVLNSESGRRVLEKRLDAAVIGPPAFIAIGATRGILLVLQNGTIEIRGADGSLIKSSQLGSEPTTAPLIVQSAKLTQVVVGSRDGLLALSLDQFKVTSKIAPDGDVVRGTLAATDVDGDGLPEIVFLTTKGRIALASTMGGMLKWYAGGAHQAEGVAFADVNADRILDVIVPDETAFALGYSGRDGALIWKVEEGGRSGTSTTGLARTLVVAPHVSGGIIVGSDPGRVGLRAVELPAGAIKAAAN
jgi:hypothetical protein